MDSTNLYWAILILTLLLISLNRGLLTVQNEFSIYRHCCAWLKCRVSPLAIDCAYCFTPVWFPCLMSCLCFSCYYVVDTGWHYLLYAVSAFFWQCILVFAFFIMWWWIVVRIHVIYLLEYYEAIVIATIDVAAYPTVYIMWWKYGWCEAVPCDKWMKSSMLW